MIRAELFAPKRIVVAGGSEQRSKPGGKLLQNLLEGGYSGDLMVLNPGKDSVQGVMLGDALSEGGLQIPALGAQAQTDLKGMLKIEGVEGVLVQKMAEGMELFIGALVHFTALCHGDKRAGFESTDW